MRWNVIFVMALVLSGCSGRASWGERVDRWMFATFGGTLFGSPDLLTLKEIHLDTGMLAGRKVVVEGLVAETGKHGTYLVLKDETARLLVVLTEMAGEWEAQGGIVENRGLRVLGIVESGKKGLPYLKAYSVSVAESAQGES